MQAHKLAASRHVLYDREAAKRPAQLQVNSDLLEKAHELGVDLATILEEALALEVHRRQRETWLAENRAAIEAYNEHVVQYGVFSEDWGKGQAEKIELKTSVRSIPGDTIA